MEALPGIGPPNSVHRFGADFGAFLDALWRRFSNSIHRFGEDFGAFLDPFWRRFPNSIHRFGADFGAFLDALWRRFSNSIHRFWVILHLAGGGRLYFCGHLQFEIKIRYNCEIP